MPGGYDLLASPRDLPNRAQSLASQSIDLFNRIQSFAQFIEDQKAQVNASGVDTITAAYNQITTGSGTQDAADLETMIGYLTLVLAFAGYDGQATLTSGPAAVTVNAGEYCVVSSDPAVVGQMQMLGKGKTIAAGIRKLASIPG
jgi:mevalonate kinase